MDKSAVKVGSMENTQGKIRRLRKLLAYTGRRDVVRKLDEALGSSVMSSEIVGEAMLVLEEFRRTDPVRHQEVTDLADEILTDLRKSWG